MAAMCKFTTIMQTHVRPKRNIMLSPLNLNMRAFFSSQQNKDIVDEPVLSSPCLILPQNEAINETYQVRTLIRRCFYDLGKKRFLPAPEEQYSGMIKSEEGKTALSDDASCFGSSHGWLAFFNPSNCSIYLMNPLTLRTIPLPPLDNLFSLYMETSNQISHDPSNWNRTGSASSRRRGLELRERGDHILWHPTGRFLEKIIFSSPPDSTDCKVLMSWDHRNKKGYGWDWDRKENAFAFCRVGDKKWTVLSGNPIPDIIYSNKNQKFYGVRGFLSYERGTAEIYEWDVDSSTKNTVLKPSISYPEVNDVELDLRNECQTFKYLVESSSGEILIVLRHRAHHVADGDVVLSCEEDPCYEFPNRTIRFDVYKLDPVKMKLKYVKNLGDQSLFLGINHSFSLSASAFPEIKPNSIYFSDNHRHPEHYDYDYFVHCGQSCDYNGGDFGIFSLEDNTISPCYHSQTKEFLPFTSWLEPPQRSVRF